MRWAFAVRRAEFPAEERAQLTDRCERFTLGVWGKIYGHHVSISSTRYVINVPEAFLPLFHVARQPVLEASLCGADVKIQALFHEDLLSGHSNPGRAPLPDDQHVRRKHTQSYQKQQMTVYFKSPTFFSAPSSTHAHDP